MIAAEDCECRMVEEMVPQIVIRGPNVVHCRLAAVFKGLGQLRLRGSAARPGRSISGACGLWLRSGTFSKINGSFPFTGSRLSGVAGDCHLLHQAENRRF
jgi:hypothetical protein